MKIETSQIKPANYYVTASVLFEDEVDADSDYTGPKKTTTQMSAEFYHGKVEGIGPYATDENQCPGLEIGDHVVFSQAAGSSVSTSDKYCKVIRGYDIVAKVKDTKMTEESMVPTADRLMVKILGESQYDDDGTFIGNEVDPLEKDTQQGVILSVGPTANKGLEGDHKFKKGDTVYFDPYCGNIIVDNSKMKLKTLRSADIIFSI
jgi:co-chaperonin GroES (HSP10)